MHYSRALSVGTIFVVLVITVAPKIRDFKSPQQILADHVEAATAKLLIDAGYDVTIEERLALLFRMHAQRGDCRLQVREAAAEGFTAQTMNIRAAFAVQMFAYRGTLSGSEPTLRATVAKQWSWLRWRLGVPGRWWPVLQILGAGPCDIASLPWDEVAAVTLN
jgi:hypothetical protein